MSVPIQILTAERDGNDGLIVTFSDGTTGAYVVEELLELRPFRTVPLSRVPPRRSRTLPPPSA
jgi:hypothetical protein